MLGFVCVCVCVVSQSSPCLSSLVFILFPSQTELLQSSYPLSHQLFLLFGLLDVDAPYCIFYFIHLIMQLQNIHLTLFCDFCIFVKFLILTTYYFPDIIELSLFSCSSLSFLKTVFWIPYLVNCRSPFLWVWLVKDYCELLVMSCFLDFSCFLEFRIAFFAFEVVVTSSDFY